MAGTLVIDAVKSGTSGPPSFQNTSGVEVGQLCRAWVNFNGVTTATIRASFNVSSVTRNATGDYTVNFTNALADANYSVVGAARRAAANEDFGFALKFGGTQTATAVQVCSRPTSNSVLEDGATVCVSIFR